ncbi:response regulator [soil metagenome]
MSKTISFFLIDDDQDDNFLFEEALSQVAPSVKLFSALDGKDALERLLTMTELPDLILLDLNMPVVNGKECLAQLKYDQRLKDIPVIMYTTSSQSADIEETLQHGAICFITKPDNIRELKKILSVIYNNISGNLYKALQALSNETSTFIVC